MSKRRFTDICKWDDPWFMDLPISLKLLWLYVLDNCDHAGIWKVNIKLAEFKMGVLPPWGEGVGRVPLDFKDRIEAAPRLGDYWFIPKFLRHQYGENLNKGDAFKSAFILIESHGFLESLRRVYGESVDSLGRVKAKATAKAMAKEDKGSGEKKQELFASFWNAYPKKIGKGAAEKAWEKISSLEAVFERIMGAVAAQSRSVQWLKDGGQFIPHPATWLNQKRWEDEVQENFVPAEESWLQTK